MRDPSIIRMTPEWFHGLPTGVAAGFRRPDGSRVWVPARPEGYASILVRFRAAWLVFTGRADALVWPEGQ